MVIVPGFPRGRNQHRDKWLTHGAIGGPGLLYCASGNGYPTIAAILKDGSEIWYVYSPMVYADDFDTWLDYIRLQPFGTISAPAFGEKYNFGIRPQILEKGTPAAIGVWAGLH